MRQFILFFEIVVIISDIIYKSLIDKFQYSGSSTVDKVTVMGNVEDRSGVIVQELSTERTKNELRLEELYEKWGELAE